MIQMVKIKIILIGMILLHPKSEDQSHPSMDEYELLCSSVGKEIQ